MEALLVIDTQNGLLDKKDFSEEIRKIKNLIAYFKNNNSIVIFTKHIDRDEKSIFYEGSYSSEILEDFKEIGRASCRERV